MTDPDDLTPAERRALASLSTGPQPGRLLEERTVQALRAEGLLRTRPRRFPAARRAAAAAVAAGLFFGGLATGQWIAGRETGRMVSQLEASHAMEAALLVQRTGSAYAQAIAGLATSRNAGDSLVVAQGREVALSALYGAANQLVRISPDDPLVVRILQAMEQERADTGTTAAGGTRRVIWF